MKTAIFYTCLFVSNIYFGVLTIPDHMYAFYSFAVLTTTLFIWCVYVDILAHNKKVSEQIPVNEHKRIFIISPYTHDDMAVVYERVEQTEEYFLNLINRGHFPVSVIVACHHLTEHYKIPASFNFWADYCASEMKTCDEVHLLELDGWETSIGVTTELSIAKSLGFIPKHIEVRNENGN